MVEPQSTARRKNIETDEREPSRIRGKILPNFVDYSMIPGEVDKQ
jgi:hypothetical protein